MRRLSLIALMLVIIAGALPTLFNQSGSGLGAAAGNSVFLLAAGDIAFCDSVKDEATARILDRVGGRIATLGDHAYRSGTADEFARCYGPSWGRHKNRTWPAVGNHEYGTPGAADYFAYFGRRAGPVGKGYYSYDHGAWHVVVLNSNCVEVGGCGPGSPQEAWLRADLAAHPARCTLAYWHHTLFSSGTDHGGTDEVRPLWDALFAYGADIVLSAHEHSYERFAPQDPAGAANPERGIRQFVVGTGGARLYEFGPAVANSEVRIADKFGVLKLRLNRAGYAWRFIAAGPDGILDAGNGSCHR
ncbi:MAG: metallophosphoesterase [Chloroflexota bacterium]|nr:metallophosphoesterase [Chloroflexia bacterium]MDQ3467790.1 metallophosphoesterase [Chloroflexota bacterium]